MRNRHSTYFPAIFYPVPPFKVLWPPKSLIAKKLKILVTSYKTT